MNETYCLECGMHVDMRQQRCPKCDNPLDLQTDGSTVTIDIAHQGERVHEAQQKMQMAIRDSKRGVAKYLRLVVGTGVIREEVEISLREAEHRRQIVRFEVERQNAGAFLVQLKP